MDDAVASMGEKEFGGVGVEVDVEVGGQNFELAVLQIFEVGQSPLHVVVVDFPA
jgi:hypothetical protein